MKDLRGDSSILRTTLLIYLLRIPGIDKNFHAYGKGHALC